MKFVPKIVLYKDYIEVWMTSIRIPTNGYGTNLLRRLCKSQYPYICPRSSDVLRDLIRIAKKRFGELIICIENTENCKQIKF